MHGIEFRSLLYVVSTRNRVFSILMWFLYLLILTYVESAFSLSNVLRYPPACPLLLFKTSVNS